MPRGGKRTNAGRKRKLDPVTRDDIRREHKNRMWAWAAAQAYRKNPIVKKNLDIDRKIAEKFPI
jgi:hypothetical protein